ARCTPSGRRVRRRVRPRRLRARHNDPGRPEAGRVEEEPTGGGYAILHFARPYGGTITTASGRGIVTGWGGGGKQHAAEAAAMRVRGGMRIGLGTGTTVAHLLPLLPGHAANVWYYASSPQTERAAVELGLDVRPFEAVDRLDLTIDGADQVAPAGWLVKGGGGAHTREKILAAAAEPFLVIVSA